MALYYRGAGPWERYLTRPEAYEADVAEILDSVASVGEGLQDVRMTLSDEVREVVDSIRGSASSVEGGLQELEMALADEIRELRGSLSEGISDLRYDIAGLGALFTFDIALALLQLEVLTAGFRNIISRLDEINETLKHPLLTQARELSEIGMNRISKGLLQEGLKALLGSIEKNETDFLVQLEIGKLYLYGKNATDNIIDLPLAKKHLLLAARYANSERKRLKKATRFCAEAFFHAAIACYVQANEYWSAGNQEMVKNSLREALVFARDAMRIYPQLVEAFYNHAKFAALLGDSQTAVHSLRVALEKDPVRYCQKIRADKDFDGIREHIRKLLSSLCQEVRDEVVILLPSVQKELLDDLFYPESGGPQQTKAKIQALIEQARLMHQKGWDIYPVQSMARSLLKKAQRVFQTEQCHAIRPREEVEREEAEREAERLRRETERLRRETELKAKREATLRRWQKRVEQERHWLWLLRYRWKHHRCLHCGVELGLLRQFFRIRVCCRNHRDYEEEGLADCIIRYKYNDHQLVRLARELVGEQYYY